MPNWCANRVQVRGRSEDVEQVRGVMEGGRYPLYSRAVAQGVQLFLAGCAGMLRPVSDELYPPHPALTAAGQGDDTPENRAFTQWLMHLRAGTLLTDEACEALHSLWQACRPGLNAWQYLTEAQRACITAVFAGQRHDWCGSYSITTTEVWWDAVCDGLPELQAQPFDLLMLLPTRLDVEINGFNGRLLAGVPSGFHWYVDRYGTKWPTGYDLTVSDGGADWLVVDFDTPWSPPDEAVMAALSARYGVTVEHWYAEQGCDFCGYGCHTNGELLESISDTLEWSETDDDDAEVIGPEWIVDNIAHFGG
ncbi:Protein of unknown function [Kosakonia radicincitans]|uniref:YubB ferredoxin-like domain-containing protein n=1 Tax=Kosakonia radicincitans TaxID=283686 RepID=A0AAX2EZB9_9ENTR|nr:DUF1281 domain-containing protein [Kosakonia radicincitans]SFF38657.1 Protein of unknown function [Kosakonia radicincitans]SFR26103.1 Protein of unknown function [Kosakonia radicincitans]SFU16449.1 Protein of unknown function [Kosakonia radicincitans]SFY32473.1 Protein of unknown function [Kosakonia radicincitans]